MDAGGGSPSRPSSSHLRFRKKAIVKTIRRPSAANRQDGIVEEEKDAAEDLVGAVSPENIHSDCSQEKTNTPNKKPLKRKLEDIPKKPSLTVTLRPAASMKWKARVGTGVPSSDPAAKVMDVLPRKRLKKKPAKKTSLDNQKNKPAKKTYFDNQKKRAAAAERKRNERERKRSNPEEYAAMKAAERERSRKRRAEGKIKKIADMNAREKKSQRGKWREDMQKYRAAKQAEQRKIKQAEIFVETNTPPGSPTNEDVHEPELQPQPAPLPQSAIQPLQELQLQQQQPLLQPEPNQSDGRVLRWKKEARISKDALKKENQDLTAQVEHYRKLANQWKARFYRAQQEKPVPQPKNVVKPSPNTKAEMIISEGIDAVKKKLIVGEIISECLNSPSTSSGTPTSSGTLNPTIKQKTMREELTRNLKGRVEYIQKYPIKSEIRKVIGKKRTANIVLKTPESDDPSGRRQKLSRQIRDDVRSFLEQDDNSYSTPGKRDFITKHKQKTQKRYLSYTMKELLKKFKASRNTEISYATFCRFRPFWIVPRKLSQRDTCLCVKHENFRLLFQKCKVTHLVSYESPSQMVASLCCDKPMHAKHDCMHRSCQDCKSKMIDFQTEASCDSDLTFYYKWINDKELRVKNEKSFSVKVTKKVKISVTMAQLKENISSEIDPYMSHVYRKYHQMSFSQSLRSTLASDEVLIIIDFSENYQLKYASEIQSTHFGASNAQLTLHTGAFYLSSKQEDSDHITTFCTVSKSMRHDSAAIWAHMTPILQKIKQMRPSATKIHVLSDGPTKQYRNKTTLYLFCQFVQTFGFQQATYNFSEAGHGKSVADGVGGTIKRTVDNFVALGNDISSIELFLSAVQDLRTLVVEVKEDEICAVDRMIEGIQLSPIPQTMKIHQIYVDSSSNFNQINVRYLSCLVCRNEFSCPHYEMSPATFMFQEEMQPKKGMQDSNELSEVREQPVDETDVADVCIGQWIAVIYDDKWYPGQIIDVNEDQVKAKFMTRCGLHFLWPSKDDIQVLLISGILRTLNSPKKISSRLYDFANQVELDELTSKYCSV